MRRAIPALLAFALGCPDAPPSEPVELVDAVEVGPLDELSRRFGRLRGRLAERGYGPPRRAERRFVLEGRGLAIPVDLATGGCSTWVALGGGGLHDVTLAIHDGLGAEVGRDDSAGQGALVHVCPPPSSAPTAPHYLELRAGEGNGAVVLAEFRSELGAGEGFEDVFEGLVAPRVPLGAVRAELEAELEVLRGRALEPEGPVVFRRMAVGQGWRRSIGLTPGRCYVVSARGGEGVEDVDLFLFDGKGAEIARDLGPDATARVEHCTSEADEAVIELRCFAGAGAVGMIVASGQGRPQDAPPSVPPVAVDPSVALEAELASFVQLGPLRRFGDDVTVRPGEARTHPVLIGPGCTVVLAAGAPAELDLDLYLSVDGEVVDRDVRVRRSGVVGACSEVPIDAVLTAKAYGEGRYALARGDTSALELQDLRFAMAGVGEGGVADQRVTLIEGEPVVVRPPESRACLRAVAVGGAGILDLDAFLRDGETLVASDTGPAPWATVERCPAVGGEIVELVAYRGEGEAVVRWVEVP